MGVSSGRVCVKQLRCVAKDVFVQVAKLTVWLRDTEGQKLLGAGLYGCEHWNKVM